MIRKSFSPPVFCAIAIVSELTVSITCKYEHSVVKIVITKKEKNQFAKYVKARVHMNMNSRLKYKF